MASLEMNESKRVRRISGSALRRKNSSEGVRAAVVQLRRSFKHTPSTGWFEDCSKSRPSPHLNRYVYSREDYLVLKTNINSILSSSYKSRTKRRLFFWWKPANNEVTQLSLGPIGGCHRTSFCSARHPTRTHLIWG